MAQGRVCASSGETGPGHYAMTFNTGYSTLGQVNQSGHRGKNPVICFDGTYQQFSRVNTNVGHLFKAIVRHSGAFRE